MAWHEVIDGSAPDGFREWARTQPSVDAAWAACERADWLVWLAVRRASGDDTRQTIIRAAANAISAGRRRWYQRLITSLFDPDWEVAALWARHGIDGVQAAAGAARVLTWGGFFALFPACLVYYLLLLPKQHAVGGRFASTLLLNLELTAVYVVCMIVSCLAVHRLRQRRLRAQLTGLDAGAALAIVERELVATVARSSADRRRFQASLVRKWLPTPPAS